MEALFAGLCLTWIQAVGGAINNRGLVYTSNHNPCNGFCNDYDENFNVLFGGVTHRKNLQNHANDRFWMHSVYSIHDDQKEDRVFQFLFTDYDIQNNFGTCTQHASSEYEATIIWDETASSSTLFSGMWGHHSNARGDRIFRRRTCTLEEPYMLMDHSDWLGLNQWDQKAVIDCDHSGPGKVISAMMSEYNNNREDRRFQWRCSQVGCMSGYYGSGTTSGCLPCSLGGYQDQNGQTSCKSCPAGHYKIGRGGGTACHACGSDAKFNPEGDWSCEDCPAGYFTSGGTATTRTSCTPCGSDTMYNPIGDSSCQTCPADHFTSGGGVFSRHSCSPCTGNSYNHIGDSSCESCANSLVAISTGPLTSATEKFCVSTIMDKCLWPHSDGTISPTSVSFMVNNGKIRFSSSVANCTNHHWSLVETSQSSRYIGSTPNTPDSIYIGRTTDNSCSSPELDWKDFFPAFSGHLWNAQHSIMVRHGHDNTCLAHSSDVFTFNMHCDCNADPVNNGKPIVRAQQLHGEITFIVEERSFCDDVVRVTRQIGSGTVDTIRTNEPIFGVCGGEVTPIVDLPSIISQNLGEDVTYCASAMNTAMSYSEESCDTVQIEFYTSIVGKVLSRSGSGVEGVTIFYNIEGVTGSVVTDLGGSYTIDFQNAGLTDVLAHARIWPQKIDTFQDSAGQETTLVHEFTCKNAVSCTNPNEGLGEFDALVYHSPTSIQILQQRFEFYDDSVISIRGKTTLTDEYSTDPLDDGDGLPCAIQGIQVCAMDYFFQNQYYRLTPELSCVLSDGEGRYEIIADVGTRLVLVASVPNLPENFPQLQFVQEGGKIEFAENLWTNQLIGNDFQLDYLLPVQIRVGGGVHANFDVGRADLQFSAQCGNGIYKRGHELNGEAPETFNTGSAVEIYLPMLDFKVEVRRIHEDSAPCGSCTDYEYMQHTWVHKYLANKYCVGPCGSQGIQDLKLWSFNSTEGIVLGEDGRAEVTFKYRAPLELDIDIKQTTRRTFRETNFNYAGDEVTRGFNPPRDSNDDFHFLVSNGYIANITVSATEIYGGPAQQTSDVGEVPITLKDTLCSGFFDYPCNAILHHEGCTVMLMPQDLHGTGLQSSAYLQETFPEFGDFVQDDRKVVATHSDEGWLGAPLWETSMTTAKVFIEGIYITKVGDSMTLSDGNPLAIVYDPPGDASWSSLKSGTTFASEIEIENNIDTVIKTGVSSGSGSDTDVVGCSGIGFSVCTQVSKNRALVNYETNYIHGDGSGDREVRTSTVSLQQEIATASVIDPQSILEQQFGSTPRGYSGFLSTIVVSQSLNVKFTEALAYSAILENSDPSAAPLEGVLFAEETLQVSIEAGNDEEGSFNGYSVLTIAGVLDEISLLENNIATLNSTLDNPSATFEEWQEFGSVDDLPDHIVLNRMKESLVNWKQIVNDVQAVYQVPEGRLVSPASYGSHLNSEYTVNGESRIDYNDQVTGPISLDFEHDSNLITFSGGGTKFGMSMEWEESRSESSLRSYSNSFQFILEVVFDLVVGPVRVFGSNTNDLQVDVKYERTTTSQTTSTKSVDFELSDGDIGDKLDVGVYIDTYYGTPFFKLESGRTSCPAEDGSQKRDGVALRLDTDTTLSGIPPNEEILLVFQLYNRSPTNETRDLAIRVLPNSNDNGIQIYHNGLAVSTNPVVFYSTEADDEGQTVTFTAIRAPYTYNFPGLTFEAFVPCDPLISSQVTFDVSFDDYCPAVSMLSIQYKSQIYYDGIFKINYDEEMHAAGEYVATISAYNPDAYGNAWFRIEKLESIVVQYREEGDVVWTTAKEASSNGAADTAYLYHARGSGAEPHARYHEQASSTIDIALPPPTSDGAYEIRLYSHCGGNVDDVSALTRFTSMQWFGVLDRNPIVLFSDFQDPADHVFSPGDEIGFTFTEPLECSQPYSFSAATRIEVSKPVAGMVNASAVPLAYQLDRTYWADDEDVVQIYCQDTKIYFALDENLMELKDREMVNIIITPSESGSGILDRAGNRLADTISWWFYYMKAPCQAIPQLSISSLTSGVVPQGGHGLFTFSVENVGNLGGDFEIRAQEGTLAGLRVSINGLPLPRKGLFVEPGQNLNFEVTVERGEVEYVYSGVEFEAITECTSEYAGSDASDIVVSSALLGVEFEEPCSAIDWSFSQPVKAVLNSQHSNNIDILLQNPRHFYEPWVDSEGLQISKLADDGAVKIQYRAEGSQGAWNDAVVDPNMPSVIESYIVSEGEATFSWRSSSLPTSGTYEVRALTICDNGSPPEWTAQNILLNIDRESLDILGSPTPMPGSVLDAGQNIELEFTKELDCSGGTPSVVLTVEKTGDEVPTQTLCQSNKLTVALLMAASFSNLQGEDLTIRIGEEVPAKDLAGNEAESTVWSFTVNQVPGTATISTEVPLLGDVDVALLTALLADFLDCPPNRLEVGHMPSVDSRVLSSASVVTVSVLGNKGHGMSSLQLAQNVMSLVLGSGVRSRNRELSNLIAQPSVAQVDIILMKTKSFVSHSIDDSNVPLPLLLPRGSEGYRLAQECITSDIIKYIAEQDPTLEFEVARLDFIDRDHRMNTIKVTVEVKTVELTVANQISYLLGRLYTHSEFSGVCIGGGAVVFNHVGADFAALSPVSFTIDDDQPYLTEAPTYLPTTPPPGDSNGCELERCIFGCPDNEYEQCVSDCVNSCQTVLSSILGEGSPTRSGVGLDVDVGTDELSKGGSESAEAENIVDFHDVLGGLVGGMVVGGIATVVLYVRRRSSNGGADTTKKEEIVLGSIYNEPHAEVRVDVQNPMHARVV